MGILDIRSGTHRQDFAHDFRRLSAKVLAETVEGLEVGLVERVPDQLHVHLVQVRLADAVDEERG